MDNIIPDSEFVPDNANPEIAKAEQDIAQGNALQQKYGGLGNQALAGAAGTARGLTLGASDLALTKSGLVSPQTLSGLQQANPLTSGLGSMVGGGALLAGTGGLSGLAEGAGVAAKLGVMGAEGGIFGAGQSVSDYAMGDPDLNAQKVLANVGMGAALGVGFGALGKAVESGAPKAVQGLTSSLSKLNDFAIGTEEAPGVLPSIASKIAPEIAPEWTQKFWDGIRGGDPDKAIPELVNNLNDVVNNAKQAVSEVYNKSLPARIESSLKDMAPEQANAIGENVAEKIKNLTQVASSENAPTSSFSSPQVAKIVGDRIGNLEADLSGAESPVDVHNALSGFAKELDKGKLIKFDTIPTAAQQYDQTVLRQIRDTVRGNLRDPNVWGETAAHYGEATDNYAAYVNSLKNFQKSFMSSEVSANGTKNYVINPGKVQSLFNNFDNVAQDLRKGYMNDFINQAKKLSESAENYSGFEKGVDSISEQVTKLADKNTELSKLALALQSKEGSASPFGKSGIMGEASGAVAANALGIPHPVIGVVIGSMEALKYIKNPYGVGQSINSTYQKLSAIGKMVEKTTNLVSKGAASIFANPGSRGAIEQGAVALNAYKKNSSRISELMDAETMTNHLQKTTEALQEAAPNISMGLQATMSNGVNFLNSKLPKPTSELPLSAQWEPTNSQKSKFNRYFQAVNDPVTALKQIKNGTLSNETMEALQTVHPQLLQEMQQKVVENMKPETARKLNYATQIALTKFLGTPLDEAMLPQVMMANQGSFAMNAAAPMTQGGQRKKQSTQGGLAKLNESKRTATESQELEEEA